MRTRNPAPPATGLTSLYLRICRGKRSTLYKVYPLLTEPPVANVAWRLHKLKDGEPTGEEYTAHLDKHGVHCTCMDFLVRRENVEREGCKHCRALGALGLLRPLRVGRIKGGVTT